jgi:hypothetical protein
MEKQGLIGPEPGGGRSRELLGPGGWAGPRAGRVQEDEDVPPL